RTLASWAGTKTHLVLSSTAVQVGGQWYRPDQKHTVGINQRPPELRMQHSDGLVLSSPTGGWLVVAAGKQVVVVAHVPANRQVYNALARVEALAQQI
ncbi:MAG: hypothetical protein KC620_20750, partial [Myxococcales bacterium]|nr:hypothetical protein [Myxococcales bacterium]